MNPPSMESIFLILSGAILVAGLLYWLWSHIQLTQKKVALLENAVFELRGMVPRVLPEPLAPAPVPSGNSYSDLADDDWEEEKPSSPTPQVSTPLEELPPALVVKEKPVAEDLQPVADDLQPGGRLEVPVDTGAEAAEQFRELFVGQEVVAPRTPEGLESMPVRDLRRLAEQRGLTGVADMRKKELLTALRDQIKPKTEVTLTLDMKADDVEVLA
jgi:hypothetical protein